LGWKFVNQFLSADLIIYYITLYYITLYYIINKPALRSLGRWNSKWLPEMQQPTWPPVPRCSLECTLNICKCIHLVCTLNTYQHTSYLHIMITVSLQESYMRISYLLSAVWNLRFTVRLSSRDNFIISDNFWGEGGLVT
jgi:hypothetical protein